MTVSTDYDFDNTQFNKKSFAHTKIYQYLALGSLVAATGLAQAQEAPAQESLAPVALAQTSHTQEQQAPKVNKKASRKKAKSSPKPTTLETVLVTGNKANAVQTVLPNRKVKGIYGTETTVVDTPRSVSQINPEQLSKDPIFSADDLIKYTPGLTKGGGQNAGIAPIFRAQGSEVFQDGQRGYSVRHPANLNAYEGADIVAGPSSVVFGSATGSGGYINYLTKKPKFDDQQTKISGVLGTWVPDGDSRDGSRITIDNTGPISDELAYRVSVTRQRWEDYYDNVESNYDAYYGAIAWQPSASFRLDWNLSYDDYFDWNITHGWNRPSQELVDKSKYWAGRATPIIQNGSTYWSPVFESGAADSSVLGWVRRSRDASTGQYLTVADSFQQESPNTLASPGVVRGWVYDATLAGNELVKISPQKAQRAEDQSTSERTKSQLRLQWDFSPTASFTNSTYYQDSSDTTDATGTFQLQSSDKILDNRTEFLWKGEYDLGAVAVVHDTNTGVIYRNEKVTSIAANNSFFHINAYDLNLDPSTKSPEYLFGISTLHPLGGNGAWIGSNGGMQVYSDYFGYLNFPSMIAINNSNKLYAETYASYTTQSDWTTITAFTQHNLLFDERYGLNLGASHSYVDASIENPLAQLDPQKRERKDEDSYNLYAGQVSFYVKPSLDSSVYITYDRSLAINTGGFANTLSWGSNSAANPNGANELNDLAFESLSELYELGYKTNLSDNLFWSIAYFKQARDTSPDQFNNIARFHVKGVESALRYQVNEQLSSGLNLTQIKGYSEYQSQSGFAPRGFIPDDGTVFSDSNVLNLLPSGRFDAVQLPEYTLSGFVDYRLLSGFGVELSAWWTSEWYVNLSKTVKIPNEFNIDTSFYYRADQWSAAIQILNVTNELNFVNGLSSPTNTFLQPMRGRSVQAQFSYQF